MKKKTVITILVLLGLLLSACSESQGNKSANSNTPVAISRPTSLPTSAPSLTSVNKMEPVTIQRKTSLEMMTLDDLIKKSELIIIGEATITFPSYWMRQNEKDAQEATLEEIYEDYGGLFTDSIFTITQVIKGAPEDSIIRVRTFTGETKLVHVTNSSEPKYEVGHAYLLFLVKDTGPTQIVEPGDYIAAGAIQGVYEIVGSKANPQTGTEEWYLDEFVAYIRQTMRLNFSWGPHASNPLGDGDIVSLEEAQARLPFQILLPEGFNIKEVRVSSEDVALPDRSITIQFEHDLLLTINQAPFEPNNWDEIIEIAPEFTKIIVNGHYGMGASPGTQFVRGEERPYPGSVEWWMDGIMLTLYTDTRSLDELLKIAETVH